MSAQPQSDSRSPGGSVARLAGASTIGAGNGQRIPWHGWLWVVLGLAALAVSTLHIFIDAGVALFDLKGTLSNAEIGMLVSIALIHVWWVISFVAGTHGRIGGIASVAVLALGWTALTNGFPIVYCPVPCAEAAPLSDVAHLGSLVFGPLAALACVWGIVVRWHQRRRALWLLPLGAAGLVVAAIVCLAHTAV